MISVARTGRAARSAVPPGMVAATRPSRTGTAAYALGLTKSYGTGSRRRRVLAGVDIRLRQGELTAVMGPPGAGKSTLLRAVGGLEPASEGSVVLGGVELTGLPDDHRLRLCAERVSFLSSDEPVEPSLTVGENVTLASAAACRNVGKEWFDLIVDTVGLGEDLDAHPDHLPDSARLRIGLARALLGRPLMIVADDPASGLGHEAVLDTLDALRRAVDVLRQTVVTVVSEPVAAAYADEVLFLSHGQVVDQTRAPSAQRVVDRMTMLDVTTPTP